MLPWSFPSLIIHEVATHTTEPPTQINAQFAQALNRVAMGQEKDTPRKTMLWLLARPWRSFQSDQARHRNNESAESPVEQRPALGGASEDVQQNLGAHN